MSMNFFRSEQGLKEYEKIGVPYPPTREDETHDAFIMQTKDSTHSNKNRDDLLSMTRVLAADGKEYLTYDITHRRYDNLGNEKHSNIGSMGTFPIPIPRYEMRMGPNMEQKQEVAEILRVETGYSIPFTAGAADKIYKMVEQDKQQRPTHFYAKRGNASLITIKNFNSFTNAEFWELEKFGQSAEQFMEEQKAIQAAKTVVDQAASPKEKEDAAKMLVDAGETGPSLSAGATALEEEGKAPPRSSSSKRSSSGSGSSGR